MKTQETERLFILFINCLFLGKKTALFPYFTVSFT